MVFVLHLLIVVCLRGLTRSPFFVGMKKYIIIHCSLFDYCVAGSNFECPAGWDLGPANNRCFRSFRFAHALGKDKGTWGEGANLCGAAGVLLATLRSDEELEFVRDHIVGPPNGDGSPCWLGLRRPRDESGSVEGESVPGWRWLDEIDDAENIEIALAATRESKSNTYDRCGSIALSGLQERGCHATNSRLKCFVCASSGDPVPSSSTDSTSRRLRRENYEVSFDPRRNSNNFLWIPARDPNQRYRGTGLTPSSGLGPASGLTSPSGVSAPPLMPRTNLLIRPSTDNEDARMDTGRSIFDTPLRTPLTTPEVRRPLVYEPPRSFYDYSSPRAKAPPDVEPRRVDDAVPANEPGRRAADSEPDLAELAMEHPPPLITPEEFSIAPVGHRESDAFASASKAPMGQGLGDGDEFRDLPQEEEANQQIFMDDIAGEKEIEVPIAKALEEPTEAEPLTMDLDESRILDPAAAAEDFVEELGDEDVEEEAKPWPIVIGVSALGLSVVGSAIALLHHYRNTIWGGPKGVPPANEEFADETRCEPTRVTDFQPAVPHTEEEEETTNT